MLIVSDNDVVGTVAIIQRVIGNAKRVLRDPAYAERCAISLLDLMERMHMLCGTGRLAIP